MKKTSKTNRKYIPIFMILFVLCFSFSSLFVPTNIAHADTSDFCTEQPYKCFDDGKKKDYTIDSVPDHEAENEDKTTLDKISDALTFKTIKEKLNPMNFIAPALNTLVNLFFKLNMYGTDMMLLVTDIAFNNSIIDAMIDKIQYDVKSMAGTSTIGKDGVGKGLFGNLAYPIAIITVVYGIYLLAFRQSILSSFKVMGLTVLTITLAIILFANYGAFMKNANKLTTDLSEFILSAGTNNSSNVIEVSEDGSTISPHVAMKSNLWVLMVERPYFFMTFGESNLGKVTDGEERFKALATTRPGTEERFKVLVDEVNEYKNEMILDSNATTKLGFVPIYQLINGIMSIPFVILMLMMIVYQFWFLIMAILAPFALLVASIPGQIGVLKRYSIELFYPLLAKVGLSFMVLFVFMFSDLVYSLNEEIYGSDIETLLTLNPMYYYYLVGIFNIIIFGILFILRKRIKDIFLAGSQTIKDFRDNQGNPFKESVQKTVKTTATVGGAIIGGVATGGAGAVMGASIGGTVGNLATGQGSVEDVSRTALSTALMADKAKAEKLGRMNKQSAETTNVPQLNTGELKEVYDRESVGQKRAIADAGKEFERYENLQNTPQGQLKDEDRKFMEEYEVEYGDDLRENLDDKIYQKGKKGEDIASDLSDTQKYQVLRDNGVIDKEIISKTRIRTKEVIDIEEIGGQELSSGMSDHIPITGTVSAKEVGMSKVSTMKVDDMSMMDLKEFGSNLDSTEFGQRLTEAQRQAFKDTIDSGDLEHFMGKQVQDIYGGNPVNEPNRTGFV